MPTASEVPRPHARPVRAAPGPDPPGFEPVSHKGGVTHRFLAYSSPSRLPDPDHLAVLARPGFVRAAPPSPAPPGSGCPQLHRPAATGSAAKVSHLHSNHSASRRTHDLRHTSATLAAQAGPARPLDVDLGRGALRGLGRARELGLSISPA